MPKLPVLLLTLAAITLVLGGCGQGSGISLRQVANELEKIDTQNAVPTPTATATVTPTANAPVAFTSNGDLISGWYWLRDSALKQYGEWTIKNIPVTGAVLQVDLKVLATDTFSGGRGHDAKVTVYYGLPSNKDNPRLLEQQVVTLPNTSPASDPVGYTCEGKIYIPHLLIGQNSELYIKMVRGAASDNHVAVNAASIVAVTSAEGDTTTR